MSELAVVDALDGQSVLHITDIGEIQTSTLEHQRHQSSNVVAGLPAQIDGEDGMCSDRSCSSDSEQDQSMEDDIDRSVSLSSLAWEAYELSSDWSKALKGDHGILAALDLSLPLPMCNVDLSSPTKPRDILDIFGDVMDLPPLNNFMEGRPDTSDQSADRCGSSSDVNSIDTTSNMASSSVLCVNIASHNRDELDRSNTLMTPQELERMPDQGLEFEQSVGPKECPLTDSAPPAPSTSDTCPQATSDDSNMLCSGEAPVVLSHKGDELTSITVLASTGKKTFKVNTEQLRQAATLMQPVIINSDSESCSFTLVMMPVSKMKILPSNKQRAQSSYAKYKCLHCDKTFERSYRLRIHEMTKHTMDKPFKCAHPGCKWAFSTAYKLRNHEQCHLKVKAHVCDLCDKAYTSYWNLQTHIDAVHDEGKLLFECEMCNRRFLSETKLYKHISDCHPEQPKRFECDEEGCTYKFHSKLGLMRHMVAHKKRKELNLICPFPGCGKTFTWKSRLDLHVKTHTGEHNYKCTFQGCTAAFVNASVLNRHMKIHSTDKSLNCPQCAKTFHRVDHLRNHLLSHSVVRPFLCTEPGCRYASTSRRALQGHLKRHALRANRARLVCPDQACTNTFGTMPKLLKHINANHPHIMEVRYAKELQEKSLEEHSAEERPQVNETLLATRAVAGSEDCLPWNLQDVIAEDRYCESMTVMKTEVGGKHIELILPTADPERAASPVTVFPEPQPVRPKLEKGSARTDSLINNRVCAKARARQQQQKEQSFSILDTGTANVEQELDVNESHFVGEARVGGAEHRTASVNTAPSTIGNGLLASSSVGSMSSIPSSLEWFSSSQEGGEDSARGLLNPTDIIYTVSTGRLESLTEQIDDSADFNQLYCALD